jgi:hypothetical protein
MGKVIAQASMSLDGDYAGSPFLLDDPQIVQGDRVTHLHYRVRRTWHRDASPSRRTP